MSTTNAIPFERFLNIRAAGGASFHPSGGRVAFITDITGLPQIWTIPTTGGDPEQLVSAPDRVSFVRYAPTDGRLVFGMDSGGNEQQQLYLFSSDGDVRDLTQRPDRLHYWGGWSPDGRRIALAANRRDPRFFDIYICDVASGELTPVLETAGTLHAGDFDPAGQRLIVIRHNGSLDQDLLILDLATRRAVNVTPHQGKAVYKGVTWTPDGGGLFLLTDQDREFRALAHLNLDTLALTFLDTPDWDIEALALSPDGRTLAYSVNIDGLSELRLLDAARRERLPAPSGLPTAVHEVFPISRDPEAEGPLAWSPDSRHLAVSLSSATEPANIWLVDRDGGARRLTASSLADVPRSALTAPDLIHYPTFDDRQIPAFYYRPSGVDGPLPVLVWVHGGPEGQYRPDFHPEAALLIAYFVHRGYAVLAPNVRGSTGYGRTYTHLDDIEKRMDSVADLAAAVDWLTTEGGADPRRIAVMGRSYGGFMVLAAITEYPDLWAAAIDVVGIGNFVTFLERTGAYRRKHRESEYGSLEHHRDVLERISPIHKVDRITAPLMVIHGANDPRVPIYETEQMVAILRARNHPVEFLRFEDEGHGIARIANRITAYTAVGAFLDRYLT